MQTQDIRKRFLDYFEAQKHRNIPSSSLVPETDPSLLFTNAGMVQFKNVFLGAERRDYRAACSAQLCLRAGGKHNDLENVGYTARHHTLFEMLGNFSFGSYFKKEAVNYAWDFLTNSDSGLGINPKHLWITVFGGGKVFGKNMPEVPKDEEAYKRWAEVLKKAGFSDSEIKKRITRINSADNFWMMGDTGPCGPCSEVFYNPDKNAARFVGEDPEYADICVEIWNLVFMEYNRRADSELDVLPEPCVDTGMGLERAAAVMQGVSSNYETDLFVALMSAVDKAIVKAGGKSAKKDYGAAHRVIADHLRAAVFVVSDGVTPGNEGRGYVLRRIIRRALRHAHQLGVQKRFLAPMVATVVKLMQGASKPEDIDVDYVANILDKEEERFQLTLDQGMRMLSEFFDNQPSESKAKICVDGELVFRMHDTYGFPPDLTADIAREHDATIDWEGYKQCLEEQRARGRKSARFQQLESAIELPQDCVSEFSGYDTLRADSVITHLLAEDGDASTVADKIAAGASGGIVLKSTPFYAEGGGQVGDHGLLLGGKDKQAIFEVEDTKCIQQAIVHYGTALSDIAPGEKVEAVVDVESRRATARNHSATHLLHAALIKVLGAHVKQKGSLVNEQKLRFDFSHHEAVSPVLLQDIENAVNREILNNNEVHVEMMSYDDAMKKGAIALFGDKYGDSVRVLSMGEDFSTELCGGTHVRRTGDIGAFVMVEESAVAAGIRRIEALSGALASEYCRQQLNILQEAAQSAQCKPEQLVERVQSLQSEYRDMEKQLRSGGANQSKPDIDTLIGAAKEIQGVRVLAQKVEAGNAKLLRDCVDLCRDKLGDSVVFLAATRGNDLLLASGVSKSLCAKISAGNMMREFSSKLGGKGGGSPDFAQGAGNKPAALDKVLKQVPDWVAQQLV